MTHHGQHLDHEANDARVGANFEAECRNLMNRNSMNGSIPKVWQPALLALASVFALVLALYWETVVAMVTTAVSFGIKPSSAALLRRASRNAVQPAS